MWSRNLSDGSIAVAFYNENDAPRSIGTSFAALGWAASARASVRDLWAHTDNGTATGAVENVTVRAHATVVLRLTPLKTNDAITLDPSATADRFDGIGGVSGGGGGTRLLYDYAPIERSAILDLLFKPKHGAALHVLKVGIGPDGDTTQGSEASHMRTIDDRSPTAFDRGYENWFMVEAKARNDKIHLSGLEWGVPGWVTQWWKSNATAAAATVSDGATEAATDECSTTEAAQQWTFNYKALGQLCNGRKKCLNVEACDTTKPIILFQPSFPGSSCVKKCGCIPVKGKTCNQNSAGTGPHALDCNTNEEFELSACDAPAGCPITNAIDLGAIVERADGSIVLKGGGKAKPSGDPWIYNTTTKHLKNSRTGNCLGRWQNPPPGPPRPAPGRHATVSTQHNIEYLIRWVKGLKEKKNLTIDSIGVGYNEGPYNTTWIKLAKKAFVAAGLAALKTIGTDDCCGGEYRVVAEMKKDAELMGAIDILGAHCVGTMNHQKNPGADVLALDKPLWNTEQHFGLPDPNPIPCWVWQTALELASTLNQQYVVARQTSVQMWCPIYSWYDFLPYAGKGLMVANHPWDGSYNVSDTIWIAAHTTQFTEIGWRYLAGAACSLLPGGGSQVALVSPTGTDVSIVIETVGANTTQIVKLQLAGKLSSVATLDRWATLDQQHVFIKQAPLTVTGGAVSASVPPNSILTLSTIRDAKKGEMKVNVGTQRPFASLLPYSESFDSYPDDTLAKYFSDMEGSFAVAPDAASASSGQNKVYRQFAGIVPPKCTHGGGSAYSTVIGDRSLSGYTLEVSVRFRAEDAIAGAFAMVGSHAGATAAYQTSKRGINTNTFYNKPFIAKSQAAGAVLVLKLSGNWTLTNGAQATIASGLWSPKVGAWHKVVLSVTAADAASADGRLPTASSISASVDGVSLVEKKLLGTSMRPHGAAWLGSGWHGLDYDDFKLLKPKSNDAPAPPRLE